MNVLSGLVAPPGNGMIVEVHLDIMEAPDDFLASVNALGFENDPFMDFYPAQYRFHYTGRTRVRQSDLARLLPGVHELIDCVLGKARAAGVKMYVESELVRDVHHFDEDDQARDLSALENFLFQTRQQEAVKADIHVEFRSGTVSAAVHDLLVANCFYWVRTPETQHFPSEQIATLQTSTFGGAQQVYDRLVALPLPGCTGIHLEQKLAMIASQPGLPMPPAITVTSRAAGMMRSELIEMA